MKLLFVDDRSERIAKFKEIVAFVPQIATSPADAIKALTEPRDWTFDIAFIEHDFKDERGMDPASPDSGMELVRFICEHKPAIGMIVIHTQNLSAAQAMAIALSLMAIMVTQIHK